MKLTTHLTHLNAWDYTSTPPNVFMTWCLSFTFHYCHTHITHEIKDCTCHRITVFQVCRSTGKTSEFWFLRVSPEKMNRTLLWVCFLVYLTTLLQMLGLCIVISCYLKGVRETTKNISWDKWPQDLEKNPGYPNTGKLWEVWGLHGDEDSGTFLLDCNAAIFMVKVPHS
jgi:hypothetical protein